MLQRFALFIFSELSLFFIAYYESIIPIEFVSCICLISIYGYTTSYIIFCIELFYYIK